MGQLADSDRDDGVEAGAPTSSSWRVAESKITKQAPLDVKVGSGLPNAERRARIEAVGNQLIAAGGSVYRRVDDEEGFWLIMQDLEGNEFCVN